MNSKSKKVLKSKWNFLVDDCAISGGWSYDGEYLIITDAIGGVYVFNGNTGKVIWLKKQAHNGGILSTAVHPVNNKFATGGQDGKIFIWNTNKNLTEKVIDLGSGWIENLSWSQNGKFLAASCSRYLYIYNELGEHVWRSDEHISTVSKVAWSANNEIATSCYGRVSFFDGITGKLSQKLEWRGSLVSMVLSPDGDIVACGSQDNTVHFWRRSTAKDSMMSGYPQKPSSLAFDATGTFLATGGSEHVIIWSFKGDGPEGTSPLTLKLHKDPITSLAFSNKGMNLASASKDGMVVLWVLRNDNKESGLSETNVGDSVANLYWNPDDSSLAALDRQGGVTVWNVK